MVKAPKYFTVKLIDELGGCYLTLDKLTYDKKRKVIKEWKSCRVVIRDTVEELEVYRSTSGEELWIFVDG